MKFLNLREDEEKRSIEHCNHLDFEPYPVCRISGGKGTAEDKIAAREGAGIIVAESPADIEIALQRAIGK